MTHGLLGISVLVKAGKIFVWLNCSLFLKVVPLIIVRLCQVVIIHSVSCSHDYLLLTNSLFWLQQPFCLDNFSVLFILPRHNHKTTMPSYLSFLLLSSVRQCWKLHQTPNSRLKIYDNIYMYVYVVYIYICVYDHTCIYIYIYDHTYIYM